MMTNWAPSFLARSHDMEGGAIGTSLALIIGIGGGAGIYLGGVLADRLSVGDPRGRVRVPAVAQILSVPFSIVVYTATSTPLANRPRGPPWPMFWRS